MAPFEPGIWRQQGLPVPTKSVVFLPRILSKVMGTFFLGDAAPRPFWKPSMTSHPFHSIVACGILQSRGQTWASQAWGRAQPHPMFSAAHFGHSWPTLPGLDPLSKGRRADSSALPGLFVPCFSEKNSGYGTSEMRNGNSDAWKARVAGGALETLKQVMCSIPLGHVEKMWLIFQCCFVLVPALIQSSLIFF